ncbi:MAG: DUF58 domain-containing protein [Oscillospiraceae bacterium]|jgi:uncharacterized protein (DUF58 family)|nr:DUF58 domain-containing protein [Oscillospiraceae bacterium]
MKEFRIFYSVITLFVLIMCFVYWSRFMPLLLLTLILCPLFSFIVMLVNFFMVGLKVTPSEIVAEKNEECGIRLHLQNRFLFPVSPIRIIGDFQSHHENETGFSKKTLMTDVPPLSKSVVNLPFRLPFRGEYTIRIYEICIFDLLKLFKLRKKLNLQARLIVLPRDKYPVDSGIETESDTESPASIISNHRSDMFNSLREYREGDSIRNIHWKLTAKQDELVIKQPEQSLNNSAVIFNDFSAEFDDDYLTRRMLDAVLETGLAVTKKILISGNGVISCWQGTRGNEKYELTEYSHYSYLFSAFTMLPQVPSPKNFGELISLFSPEIKEHHTIYIITPDLNRELLRVLEESGLAMLNGAVVITFAATPAESEIADYIQEKTKIKLLEINDESHYFNLV